MALGCRIVLDCAGGLTSSEVAAKYSVALPTVGKRRFRFAQHRPHELSDACRPARPQTIIDAKVEEVVIRTLKNSPAHATQWSTRRCLASI
jgi:putative transposase